MVVTAVGGSFVVDKHNRCARMCARGRFFGIFFVYLIRFCQFRPIFGRNRKKKEKKRRKVVFNHSTALWFDVDGFKVFGIFFAKLDGVIALRLK